MQSAQDWPADNAPSGLDSQIGALDITLSADEITTLEAPYKPRAVAS